MRTRFDHTYLGTPKLCTSMPNLTFSNPIEVMYLTSKQYLRGACVSSCNMGLQVQWRCAGQSRAGPSLLELRSATTDIARNPDRIHQGAYKWISVTMLATLEICKVQCILYLDALGEDHLHTSSQRTLHNILKYALRRMYWHAYPTGGTVLRWYPRCYV